MRTSTIFTALLASIVAINALPVPSTQQSRDVESPVSSYLNEKEALLLDAPKAIGLPAIPKPADSGSLLGQRDMEALEERGKKHHKSRTLMTASQITYYSGEQLKNPACGGSNPSPHAMIAAVKKGGDFSCGDHIYIKNGGRHVVVHVVDYCAACDSSAVDLSPGAFSKLASLDTGIIRNAKMFKM